MDQHWAEVAVQADLGQVVQVEVAALEVVPLRCLVFRLGARTCSVEAAALVPVASEQIGIIHGPSMLPLLPGI